MEVQMKIAVCDDSQLFLNEVKTLLSEWKDAPQSLSTEFFTNGDALIEAHSYTPFDIILLDVVMPLVNGIETAREIRKNDKHTKIIFITTSSEFAVDSYTVKANNYLLKPIIPELFYCAINELAKEILAAAKRIAVKTTEGVKSILITKIEYVEAQNHRVVFKLTDGSSFESSEPMYKHENQLMREDGFFKCHRSYVINFRHIDTFTTKEITMRSGVRIPISRGQHKELETAYFNNCFGTGEVK